MSNVLIIGKKAFTWTTVVATIAWAMSLAFLAVPLTAGATAVVAGDLIMGTSTSATGPGRPVYYYGADAKRYLFSQQQVYASWYGTDFSAVKTLTEAELGAIPLGGNVTIKPGYSLVKVDGPDAKVYAVAAGGVLRHVATEAVAVALYGADWAKNVKMVAEGFFTNYTTGTAVNASTDYDKAAVTTAAANIGVDKGIGSAGTTPVATGALTVALASDNPSAAVLPTGSTSVVMLKFNLTAGAAAQTVNSIKLKVTGVGATTDLSAVYLFDGATRLTTGRTVASQTRTVEFNNLALAVAASTTKTLSVVADVLGAFNALTGAAQTAATSGDTHAVSMDTVGTTATVSGSAVGNTFSIGSQGVSRVTLERLTDPGGPAIGTTGALLADFRLTAGTNDVDVKRITATVGGGVSVSDLSNFALYQGATKLADGVRVSDRVTFELATGYALSQGASRIFSVKADIGGRGGRTISTYIDSSYPTDLLVVDKMYNYGALGTFNSYREVCTAAITPATCGSFVTTISGRATVAYVGPTAGNVSPGTQDVTLFKFNMTAADQALEIRRMGVTIAGAAGGFVRGVGTATANDGTRYFTDIKIKNIDTGAVLMGPQEHTSADSATTTGEVAFTDTWTLNAGQTVKLAITADLSRTEDAGADEYLGEAYTATLSAFTTTSVREISTGQYLVVADIVGGGLAIAGQAQTVQASALTVSRASTPTSQTTVAGSSNVDVVGYSFIAGDSSAIKVSRLVLAGEGHSTLTSFDDDSTATLDDTLLSVSLWDGTTQVGTTRSPDSSGNVTFDNLNWTVAAGGTKKLTVKANVNTTTIGGTADYAYLSLPIANITAQDADGNSVTAAAGTNDPNLDVANRAVAGVSTPANFLTVNTVGTLRVAREGDTAISAIVIGGTSDVPMLRVRFTPTEESFLIDKVRIINTAAADDVALSKVKVRYPTQAGTLETKEVSLSSGVGNASGLAFYAARDQNNVLEVLADLVAINQTGVSSLTPQFGLDLGSANGTNFEAVGAGSGTAITTCTDTHLTAGTGVTCDAVANAVDVNGNFMTVRQTVPTVSLHASSPSGTKIVGRLPVLQFTVTADSHAALTLDAVTFAINASDNNNSSWNQALNLLTSDFDIYAGTNDSTTALDTANTNWVLYDAVGELLVSGTTATDVGYARLDLPTNRQISAGSSETYTVYVNFSTGGAAIPGTGANQTDSFTMSVAQEDPSTITATDAGDLITSVDMFEWSEDSPVGVPSIDGTLVKALPLAGGTIALD